MARNAEAAGHSLKTKKPQCGNTEASEINAVIDQENNVMSDNSTNVIPFNFREQQVRTLVIAGEPWFVAADVCRVLEVGNTTQAVQALDEDERAMFNIGRQGNANLVNESGLYTLILRSRNAVKKGSKPHAFRKWVTAEVLPSIRKTGGYVDRHNAMGDLVGAVIGSSGEVVLDRVIDQKAMSIPSSLRRSYRHTMKSRLRSRFNVQRTALIPAECMSDACNFVAAYVIEGEFLGKEKPNDLSMSLQDWVEACPVTRHAQAGQPVGRVILTGALCADMDTVKPLQRLINELAKQGVDVSAYEAHYHFLLEYLRENRRFLRDAQRLMEKASENEFAFRARVAA